MTVKIKEKFWPVLLVSGVLLLGLLIQLGLAALADFRGRAQAGETARLLNARAVDQALALETRELQATRQAAESSALLLEDKLRAVGDGDELLLLVNRWNPLPEGYVPQLREVTDGQQVDVRCADALEAMVADCVAAWNQPEIISSYRTQEMQQELYDNKIKRLIAGGTPAAEAPETASQSVAIPGTSEHQLGLAVDIIDREYPYLDWGQELTATQQWLMANCWKYGFILRYPNGTTELTGIIYEPWHYRYIGPDAAAELHELGITLEEYLALRQGH